MFKKAFSVMIVMLLGLSCLPIIEQTGAVTIKETIKGDKEVLMTFPESGGVNSDISLKVPTNAFIENASLDVEGTSVQKHGDYRNADKTEFEAGTSQNLTIDNGGVYLNSSTGEWTSSRAWKGAQLADTTLNGINVVLTKQTQTQFLAPKRIGSYVLGGSDYYEQYDIAVDGRGIIHAIFSTENNKIEYVTSSDNGLTWVPRATYGGTLDVYSPMLRTDPEGNVHIFYIQTAGMGGTPPTFHKMTTDGGKTIKDLQDIRGVTLDVTWGPDGTMHIVGFHGNSNGPDCCRFIYYYNSVNNGANLSEMVLLNDDGNSSGKYNPSIAVDNNNKVHVVWADDRNQASYTDADIIYTSSTDHLHFSPNKLIEPKAGVLSESPSIFSDKNNKLHLMWSDDRAGYQEIYYTSSIDGGNNFAASVLVNNVWGNRQFNLSAVLGFNGTLHAVWEAEVSNLDSNISYSFSDNGGASFFASKKLGDALWADQNGPKLAQDPFGNLFVLWKDARNGPTWSLYFTQTYPTFIQTGTISGHSDLGLIPASIDRVHVNAQVITNTDVTTKIRTSPDNATWSDWESVDLTDTVIQSPWNRYIEWVITLKTFDSSVSPLVTNITFDYSYYMTQGWFASPKIDLLDPISELTVNWSVVFFEHGVFVNISIDNGTTWFEAHDGILIKFVQANSSLKYRLDFKGLTNNTPWFNYIEFHYTAYFWPTDVTLKIGPDNLVAWTHPGVLDDRHSVVFTTVLKRILFDNEFIYELYLPVALAFFSSTAGKIKVSNISMVLDLPLVINNLFPSSQCVTMKENSSMNFSIDATDPDGKALKYDWYLDNIPVANVNGPYFIYYTSFNDAGNHTIKVKISDGRFNKSVTWNFEVLNVNRPPKMVSALPINTSVQTQRADPIEFNVTAADPDGGDLDYVWYVNGVLYLSPVSSPNVFTYDAKAQGTFNVTVVVSDGTVNVTHSWELKVIKRRLGIDVSSITPENLTIKTGKSVDCRIVASHLDNLPLNYSWYLNGIKIDGATSSNHVFKAKGKGTYRLEVRVDDGYDTVSHEWSIKVQENKGPALSQTLLIGLVILIIVIVVAVAGVALYLRGRSSKDAKKEPQEEKNEKDDRNED